MACPLQIICSGDGDNDQFSLHTENLSAILGKVPVGTKVAIVSVVGAFRTGKSFLLNFFLRYLRSNISIEDLSEDWMTLDGNNLSEGNMNDCSSKIEGEKTASFAWRGGQERQTTGIWMWSEPFLRTPKGSSDQIAVLLMDTQGMFDNQTCMALTAQIFGLSTFVSSYQIYNIERRVQEDNLQHLALFAEYGRIAVAPKDAPTTVAKSVDALLESAAATPGGESVPEKNVTHGTTRSKPFQRLQFLVRDWPNFDTNWDEETSSGTSDGEVDSKGAIFTALKKEMHTYFSEVIKDRGIEDLQSTREQISRCFGTVDCFLLPHPGLVVNKKDYSGSISQIDSMFKGMLNRYVRQIFDEELEPKIVQQRAITAPELMTYFEVYVHMFQKGNKSFPQAMTMLEATSEASNRNAQDLALVIYKAHMSMVLDSQGGRVPYLKEAILEAHHTRSVDAALAEFSSIATMGLERQIEDARVKLCTKIEQEKVRYFELNAMRNPFKDLEMYAIPATVALLGWILATATDVSCSHDICEVAETSFKNVYLMFAFGLLCVALRYPFTDIIMYTAPLALAVVAWLTATVINVSCGSLACKKTEDALKKVYLFILFSTILLAWRNFSGSFDHLMDLLRFVYQKAADLESKNA